ncbi:MAG: hypothetical protein MJ220_02895 [Bacilli bacterium]|nr:hypothetical protein [Bacilli bacterium]
MNKARLLTLLSVSMILAACGGKKTPTSSSMEAPASSEFIPESSETPVSSSENTSSSSSSIETPIVDNRTDMEKSRDTFMETYPKLLKALHNWYDNPASSTVKEEITWTRNNNIIDNAPAIPVVEVDDESVETDWYTYSYDNITKTGYMWNEDDYSYGGRSFYGAEWDVKIGNDYRYYSSGEEFYMDVDSGYAWNTFMHYSSYINDLDENEHLAWANSISTKGNALSSWKSMIKGYTGGDPARSGKLGYDFTFNVTASKEGTLDVLTLDLNVKSKFTPSKLPATLTTEDYITEFSAESSSKKVIKFDSNGIKSIELRNADTSSIKFKNVAYDKVDTGACIEEAKVTISNKYEDMPERIDTSSYRDENPAYCVYEICNPAGDIITMREGDFGEKATFPKNTMMTEDALNNGVDFELYYDRDLTKPVDLNNTNYVSYHCNLYIKYIIPEDYAYVDYTSYGTFMKDAGDYHFFYTLSDAGRMLTGPQKNFCIKAYTKSNIRDYEYELYESVLVAPMEAFISYSSDPNAKIKNDKMIDLNGGHYYSICYFSEQVA